MRVGTRVEVTYDGCGERWRGLHGTVTETVKWIGLPLIVRLDDGRLFHCGYPDVRKISEQT